MAREAWFRDRAEAGKRLAEIFAQLAFPDPVVLALPRGGVPVGTEIAGRLIAPLDLLLVRKIGAPGNGEYAIGAIVDGSPPQSVIDREAVDQARATEAYVKAEIERQMAVLTSRRSLYLAGRPAPSLSGRDIIIVDDGIATGSTIRAALAGLRGIGPASISIAAPVGPAEVVEALKNDVERIVCLAAPDHFRSVGEHYDDFRQLTDEDVIEALAAFRQPARRTPSSPSRSP